MKKPSKMLSTSIRRYDTTEATTLERKLQIRKFQKENVQPETEATAPLIYTERKDGVLPGYNIRTDKMEVALETANTISMTRALKRDASMKVVKDGDENKPESKPESTPESNQQS